MGLDDFLGATETPGDTTPDAPATPEPAAPAAPATDAASAPPVADTQALSAPTGEPTTTTPPVATGVTAPPATGTPPVQGSDGFVPLSALQEERTKRQQLKAEVDELRRQAGERSTPQPPQPQEPAWTDKVLEDLPGSFQRVETRVQEQISAQLTQQRYAQSEMLAQQFLPDYAEVMKTYPELAQVAPHVARAVHESASPALTAYQAAKQYLAAKSNNPQAIEARVRAEAQTKIQALETELSQLRAQTTADSVPTSLTSVRGSGAGTPRVDNDPTPTPLSEIVGPRRRARQ